MPGGQQDAPPQAAPRVHMLVRKALRQNARVFKQAASLAGAGYDVTVIAPPADSRPGTERVEGFVLMRAASHRFGRFGPVRWLAFYSRAYRLSRRVRGPADIIHCNDLDTLPLGVLLARRSGGRVVYDVQDLYPDQEHVPRWAAWLLRSLERRLVRRVERLVVVNPMVGEVMARRYGAHVDAVVLNCPPLADRCRTPRRPTLRTALGIAPEQTVVVYSGVLSRRRGLENAILALKHLEATCLVLLGEGPLRERLAALAAEEGLEDRVLFTGFVPHLEVPDFIRSADLGIVPYEHYGLNQYLCSPSKLFHYVMAELPVVCSDFPFLREVVFGNAIGAVFDPADPASIAQAILEMTAERIWESRERLQSVRRRYCWEEEEKRLLPVYRGLTDHPPSRRDPEPAFG